MVYSMTGFGVAQNRVDGIDIEVQVKSLNHRSLDVHINMPNMPGQVEILFQRLVHQFVGRGRVDITVTINDTSKNGAGLNVQLLEARVATLQTIFNETWTRNKCIEFCLGQHDVWDGNNRMLVMNEHFYETVLDTASKALEMLAKSRRAEGKALESYLLNALDEIDTSRQAALARAPERISEFRAQLLERIKALNLDESVTLDEARIATEVALIADKIDVTEELTRIATHLSALRILILSHTDPLTCVGKKIDFYLQELNREATTMASKSRDSILTCHTIDMRTQLEMIREQTANIQ